MKTYYNKGLFPFIHHGNILYVDRRPSHRRTSFVEGREDFYYYTRLTGARFVVFSNDKSQTCLDSNNDFNKISKKEIHEILREINFNKKFEEKLL